MTTLTTGFILKDWLVGRPVLILPVALGLFVASYVVLWCAAIFALRFFHREEFRHRLAAAWRERFEAAASQHQITRSITDYMDRVIQIQMSIALPNVLDAAHLSVMSSDLQRLKQLEQERDALRKDSELAGNVLLLADRWRSYEVVTSRTRRVIDDPIHGCIDLDDKLATVLAHPLLQRLNRVRQLSFSYTQFPSSTHSRLSHSLGVARNAELALSGILDKGVYYVPGESTPRDLPEEILSRRREIVQRGKLTALLHDIGHGPFGHALDTYVSFRESGAYRAKPDKFYTARYLTNFLSPTLSHLGFDPAEIVRILDPQERWILAGVDSLIGDIVDSQLDADRMDYLMRDAHMTGLAMGDTNTSALLHYIRPTCDRPLADSEAIMLTFDEAAFVYMEHFMYAREAMYHACYEHPRKRAAEQIFQRLIEDLISTHSINLDDLYALTDDEVLCLVRSNGNASVTCRDLADQLMTDMDFDVVHEVEIASHEVSHQLEQWINEAINTGKGNPKLLYLVQPELWEEEIAAKSIGSARRSEVQVLVPSPRNYKQQQSSARILVSENGRYQCKDFLDWRPEIKAMHETMAKHRNRVRVICPSNLSPGDRDKVRVAAIQELGQ